MLAEVGALDKKQACNAAVGFFFNPSFNAEARRRRELLDEREQCRFSRMSTQKFKTNSLRLRASALKED